MDNSASRKTHSLLIKGETTVMGVKQVLALEEKEVKLSLGDRHLLLTGNHFSAEKLSLEEGVLVLSGDVVTVKYAAASEAKGLLKRFFK